MEHGMTTTRQNVPTAKDGDAFWKAYHDLSERDDFIFPVLTASTEDEREFVAVWTIYKDASLDKIVATIVDREIDGEHTVTLSRPQGDELVETKHQSYEEAMVGCYFSVALQHQQSDALRGVIVSESTL